MSDYKKSLNLPDTSFPMKANLTQREPEMLRWWEENNIYGTMLELRAAGALFVCTMARPTPTAICISAMP